VDVIEFLGGKHEGDGRWTFAFGEHINGAFGGVFGGAIALETWVPHANPDLSLRFGAPAHGDPVVGVGRLRGIQAGLALVGIEVFAGGSLAAIGVSYSLLLQQ
jgi:hypothetical protein